MLERLAVIAALFALAIAVSTGAYADGLLANTGINGSGAGVSAPVYSSEPSEQIATGDPQFKVDYCNATVWQYDSQMGEYAGVFPTGIGATMKVYPNIDTKNLPVEAVAVGEAELEKKIEAIYDRKSDTFHFKPIPGLVELRRDENGRFYAEIPLASGTDIHCLRFYVIVRDAKRKDHTFLLIFHWKSAKPGVGLVNELRFTTEEWPAGCEKPSVEYVTDLLARAGNGGNGRVFARLIADDKSTGAYQDEAARKAAAEADNNANSARERADGAYDRADEAYDLASGKTSKDAQQDAQITELYAALNGQADILDMLAKNQITAQEARAMLDARLRKVEEKPTVSVATQAPPPPVKPPCPVNVPIEVQVTCVQNWWYYQVQDCNGLKPQKGPYSLKAGIDRVHFDAMSNEGTFRFRVYDCTTKCWGEWLEICIIPNMPMQVYTFPQGGTR